MDYNNVSTAQTIFSVIDMINNRPVGKTRVVKTQDNIWVLKNTEGKLAALMDSGRKYKLMADAIADATFIVELMKITKDFIVVKILPISGGRERRRYQRVPIKVSIKTNFVVGDTQLKGEIHELAYGSFVITLNHKMEKGDELIAHLRELDGEAAYICSMYTQKEAENDNEEDIWFAGYRYVILIDEQRSGEKAMELLYGKINRLLKEEDDILREEQQ